MLLVENLQMCSASCTVDFYGNEFCFLLCVALNVQERIKLF